MSEVGNFDVVSVDGKPKAVVIIWGWLGAKMRHLKKYADVCNSKGCSTVTGVVDALTLMASNEKILKQFDLEEAAEAARLIRGSNEESIPLILHVFSNGGCFVLEQLQLALKETEPTANVALVGKCLKLEVFDSSPAYRSLQYSEIFVRPS